MAVKTSDDPGRDHLLERINSKHGEKIIEDAARLGYGSRDYELVELDFDGPAISTDNFQMEQ